jgi:hypothetical protein
VEKQWINPEVDSVHALPTGSGRFGTQGVEVYDSDGADIFAYALVLHAPITITSLQYF